MIYYSTQPVLLAAGHEHQGIDDAIQRGLKELSVEAGKPIILTNVVPVVFSASSTCLVIIAKLYEPEKQSSLDDLIARFLTINEGRDLLSKIGEYVAGLEKKTEESDNKLKVGYGLDDIDVPYGSVELQRD